MKYLPLYKFALIALVAISNISLAANTRLLIETDCGDIQVTLYDDTAPVTVANFLSYVNNGDYDNTFFHRSVVGFILQGGGFEVITNVITQIPQMDPIANEFGASNIRGTLAMAKLSGDPDSATSQWFINLADNSTNLDNQNGGFTVFGQVDNMSVVDNIITETSIVDVSTTVHPALSALPIKDDNNTLEESDLVTIQNITIIPEPSSSALFLLGSTSCLLIRKRS